VPHLVLQGVATGSTWLGLGGQTCGGQPGLHLRDVLGRTDLDAQVVDDAAGPVAGRVQHYLERRVVDGEGPPGARRATSAVPTGPGGSNVKQAAEAAAGVLTVIIHRNAPRRPRPLSHPDHLQHPRRLPACNRRQLLPDAGMLTLTEIAAQPGIPRHAADSAVRCASRGVSTARTALMRNRSTGQPKACSSQDRSQS